ncbi:hypothetical protein ASD89_11500 [Caulobacter sp. Root656]|nr:hypothetical protein ASD89_11500 [Caulobacter sp. Root656]
MTPPQPPLSWAALLDDRDTIDRYLEELGYLEQDASASAHPPEVLLPDGADGLMAVALLLGPGASAPALDAMTASDLVGRGLANLVERAAPSTALTIVGALTAANAGAACGREAFAPPIDQTAALLKTAARELDRFPDRARFRAAFAAAAHGLGDQAAAFAYGKPRTGAFKPGEAFGPNLQALVHYLVQAVEAGASGEDVDAAIRDALLVFPYKLQDDQLGWGDLGWLGRIRFHELGDAPLGEVADRMFDYVRTL